MSYDETGPVIIIAPVDKVCEKIVSNMQDVAARGGQMLVVTDEKGAENAEVETVATIQLIAYHTAVEMGTYVDRPRNLANSVTVE